MSATLEQARELVAKYAGQRISIQLADGHTLEGRLRPGLRNLFGIGKPRFAVYGRSSNWRAHAEQFADDPVVYAKALRSFARPELTYVLFSVADRIKVAHAAEGAP